MAGATAGAKQNNKQCKAKCRFSVRESNMKSITENTALAGEYKQSLQIMKNSMKWGTRQEYSTQGRKRNKALEKKTIRVNKHMRERNKEYILN